MNRTDLIHQRKRKTVDPCRNCGLHLARCICSLIPSYDLKTRLSLVIHHRELKRTTNTGQLATRALVNSRLFVRGEMGSDPDLSHLLLPDYESYILYPCEEALDLREIRPLRPVHLIVADGNWRQAGKLHRRHRELRHLPRIKITQRNEGAEHLRREHFPEGHSTLEAIALAFQVLEGDEVGKALLNLYHAKLSATLAGRPPQQSALESPKLF